MASNMQDEQGLSPQKRLRLVASRAGGRPLSTDEGAVGAVQRARLVRAVTATLANRVQIPEGSTIVGLLGVGPSKSNFHELWKWADRELATVDTRDGQQALETLLRRFLRAVEGSRGVRG